MTTISLAIMSHPDRAKSAEKLLREVSAMPFIQPEIIYDEIRDEWDTGSRSLRYGVGKADWHVVIQDDAILTPSFYDNVLGATQNVPTKSVISLYVGTARPFGDRVKQAVDKAYSATWLSHMLLLWGVGIVIPSDHIEPMLEFVADREEAYDIRIGIFYQRNMIPVYYTMPSLVDHDDDLGSLLDHGNGDQRRVAHRLATGPIRYNRQVIQI